MLRPGNPLPGAGPAHGADGAEDTRDTGSTKGTRGTENAEGGRPRPEEESDVRRPDAAERLRTLVESNASAALVIPGIDLHDLGQGVPEARAVTPDGDVILLVPADSPAARATARALGDDLVAVMEITDVAPVAVPHRVRGRAHVAGRLALATGRDRALYARSQAGRHPAGPFPGPAWTLLRLEVGEGRIDDLWGEGLVEPDEFAVASPDPLVRHETELLQHLAAAHGDLVRGLCSLSDRHERTCGPRERVVPVALDRFGLRVRFCGDERVFDARFDFPRPVRDLPGLRRAIHALFDAVSTD